MTVKLFLGDCVPILPTLSGPFDMILVDLPYGTTACKWDTVIPFEPLWAQYKRLIKPKGAVVLFGSQPFTSALVMSNVEWFKYDLVWRKVRVTGHLDAKRRPLREHESILIFCDGQTTYNPQMTKGEPHVRGPWGKRNGKTQVYDDFTDDSTRQNVSDLYYPRSTLEIRSVMQSVHPTQKPIALLEYLIRTYTNPGETVLDNTMGSGSTGVACVNTGRSFVGIEKDAGYFEIAKTRIEKAQNEMIQAQMEFVSE
jgi:site-specific DNA-methyltransferase (adenine-specific)